MNVRLRHAPAALLLGWYAGGAVAQQGPPAAPVPAVPAKAVPPAPPAAPSSAGAAVIRYRLELLDKDRDGLVSREEGAAVPELLREFDKLDANHDGRLDDRELERFAK